jgi:hypothetical protein
VPKVRWLALGICAVAAAAALTPGVPMYDGIGNPDEPYRYVSPPAGYHHTKPADSLRAVIRVETGQSQPSLLSTGEVGPQLSLQLPVGAVATGGADQITVTAVPLSPTADPAPQDGRIVTNIYRISAIAGGGAVDVIGVGDQQPLLDLRAPTAHQPGPVFERLSGDQWVRSTTHRVGNDVYETVAPALGDWALVQVDRAGQSDRNNSSRSPLGWIAGGIGTAGVVLLLVAAIRRRRLNAKPVS